MDENEREVKMTTFGNCVHYPRQTMRDVMSQNMTRGMFEGYHREPGSTLEHVLRQMSARHVRNRTVHLLLGEMGSLVSRELGVAFNISMLPPIHKIAGIHDIVTATQIHAAQRLQPGVQPAMSTYRQLTRVYEQATRQVSQTIDKSVMAVVADLLKQVLVQHPDDPEERDGEKSGQSSSCYRAVKQILDDLESTFSSRTFMMLKSIEKGLVDEARVSLMQSAVDWAVTVNTNSMKSNISQLSNNTTDQMLGGVSLESSVNSASVVAKIQERLYDGVMQTYMRSIYSMAKDPFVFLNSLILEGRRAITLVGAMDEGAYVVPGVLKNCASGGSVNSETGVGLTTNNLVVVEGERVPVSAVFLLSRKAYDDLIADTSRGVQQLSYKIESGELVMMKKVYLKPVDQGLLKQRVECSCQVDTFYDRSDDEMCQNDYANNGGEVLREAAKMSMGMQGLRSLKDVENGQPVAAGVFLERAGKRMLLGKCDVEDEDDMVRGRSDRGGDVGSVKTTEQKRCSREVAYTTSTRRSCMFMADFWNGEKTAVVFSRMEEDVNATTVDLNNRSSALTPRKSSFMVAPTNDLKEHQAPQWKLYSVLFGGGKYDRGEGKLETLTTSQTSLLDCFPEKAVAMPDETRIFMIGQSSTNGHTGGFRGCNGATVMSSGPPASKRMCVTGLNGGPPNSSVRNESLVADKTTSTAAFADARLYRVSESVEKLNESMGTLVEQRGSVCSSDDVNGLRQARKKMVNLVTTRKKMLWEAMGSLEAYKPGKSKQLTKLRQIELYPFHDLAYNAVDTKFSLEERRFMHRVPLEDMSCVLQRALRFMSACGLDEMSNFAGLMDQVVQEANYQAGRGGIPALVPTVDGYSADPVRLLQLDAVNNETKLSPFVEVPVVGSLYNAAKCLVDMCKNKLPNPAGNMACWQTASRTENIDAQPVRDFGADGNEAVEKDQKMGTTLYGLMANLVILPAAYHGKVDVLVRGRTMRVTGMQRKDVALSHMAEHPLSIRRNHNPFGERFYTYMNNTENVDDGNFLTDVQDLATGGDDGTCEAYFNAVTQMKLNYILQDTSLSPHLKAIMLMTEFSDLSFSTHKECVEKGYHTGLAHDLVNMETHFAETAIYAPAQSHEMIVMPKTTFDPVPNPGAADGTPQALDITARTTTFTAGNGLPTSALRSEYVVPNENLVTAKTRNGLHPLICFDHVPNYDELASLDLDDESMATEDGRATINAKEVGEFVSEYVKENPSVFNNDHDGGESSRRVGGGPHELENLPRPKFVPMLRPMMSTGCWSNLRDHNSQCESDSASGGFQVMGAKRLMYGWGPFFLQDCANLKNPYAGTLCGLYFNRYAPDSVMVDPAKDRTVSMRTHSSEVYEDNGLGSQKCSDTTVWLKFLYDLNNRPVIKESESKTIETSCDRYGMSKTTKHVPGSTSECVSSHNETRRRIGLTRCSNIVAQLGCAIPYTVNGMGTQTENSRNRVGFTGFSETGVSNYQVVGPFIIE